MLRNFQEIKHQTSDDKIIPQIADLKNLSELDVCMVGSFNHYMKERNEILDQIVNHKAELEATAILNDLQNAINCSYTIDTILFH